MTRDEIKEREEEDPHDVDEVPIEADHLDARGVRGRYAAPRVPYEERDHDAFADDHVHRVHPGHREIEQIKDLRALYVLAVIRERGAGDQVLDELVVVLEGL